jgi:hypothetical protein
MRETFRKNPFNDLSFLDVMLDESAEEASCIATVDLSYGELFVETRAFLVGFRCAYLVLHSTGFRQLPESRFAIASRPYRELTSVVQNTGMSNSTEATVEVNAEANLKISAPSPSGNIHAGGAISDQKKFLETMTRQKESKIEEYTYRVRARGEGVWQFRELGDEFLDGNYLNGNELVRLKVQKESNMREITAQLVVRKRDIVFEELEKGIIPIFNSKRKLLAIMVAKCIAAELSTEFQDDGQITLSAVRYGDD